MMIDSLIQLEIKPLSGPDVIRDQNSGAVLLTCVKYNKSHLFIQFGLTDIPPRVENQRLIVTQLK